MVEDMVEDMIEDMVDNDVVQAAVLASLGVFIERHWAPCCELRNDQSYEESCGE